MSKYLSLFEQDSEYRETSKTLPNVSNVIEDEAVYYQDDYSGEYLTFKILSDGEVGWKSNHANTTLKTIQYSINNGEWTSITSSTEGTTFNVQIGDVVRFKGDNTQYGTNNSYYNSFTSTCKFSIRGNIMSLLGDDFSTLTTLPSTLTFTGLFRGCINLIDADKLLLPATTLSIHCYSRMFDGCSALIKAPNLQATTIAGSCYQYMFNGCSSLLNAPSLPATTISNYCYAEMFQGCTSLTKAPVLPATKLQLYSYRQMFQNCSSLNHITCLATNITATDCTKNWVSGVAATGTFVKAAGMENWNIDDVDGIPHGWETKSRVITQEYITANGQIETDFQLTSDNYKIVSSYYIPSIDASWKTMYYFNNGVYHQLLKNSNKLGLYFVRYNANAPGFRLVEQITSINDAPSSTGTNVVTYVEHPSNIGSGVYCDYTSSLSSAENNYPYDTWDQYLETKPSVKLTNNYTTGSSDVEIQNLKLLSSAPTGTRFYGIKVWSGDDNQVVFDGVPAKYGTDDAIYDKVSGHIYTTTNIITFNTRMIIDDFVNEQEIAEDAGYDDFSSYIQEYMKHPVFRGGNIYEYTGKQLEYEGNSYYLWQLVRPTDESSLATVKYGLTTSIDKDTLTIQAMTNDLSSRYCPFVAVLGDDLTKNYDENHIAMENYFNLVDIYKETLER